MPFPGYTGWTVQLDPPAVATAGRTMLDINNQTTGIQIGGTSSGQGPDWGNAAIQAYEASAGIYGSSVVDLTWPNRTVTIPLALGSAVGGPDSDAALAKLRAKVALIQREGGTLLRQRKGGAAMYADVVNATLAVPDDWGETSGIETGVTLTLECLPDFYGDEITLDAVHATGVTTAVLTSSGLPAVIAGDQPGRCRIVVSDTSGQAQCGLVWGFRSRHYDSASTAALFYEAEALTPLDAAFVASLAGASGGAAMVHESLSAGAWVPVMATDLNGGPALTHQGTYRVKARVQSSDPPQLRLVWDVAEIAHPVYNTAVQQPGPWENSGQQWYIIDLGLITLPVPTLGSPRWRGIVQAMSPINGNYLAIDCLYLEPLDESAGQLAAEQQPSPLAISIDASATTVSNQSGSGLAWNVPSLQLEGAFDASATTNTTGTTDYLIASGFEFTVPSTATIVGIEVAVTRMAFSAEEPSGPVGSVTDAHIQLVNSSGTITTTDRADTVTPWPHSWGPGLYGSQTDLWGTAWTPAQVNSASFGVAIAAGIARATALVNAVEVTVTYVDAGTFATTADAVIYASQSCQVRTDGPIRSDATGTVYGPVAQVTGDLPRIPPSGLENREVQLLVKPTTGDLATQPDTELGAFTAQVYYRPSYLFRP